MRFLVCGHCLCLLKVYCFWWWFLFGVVGVVARRRGRGGAEARARAWAGVAWACVCACARARLRLCVAVGVGDKLTTITQPLDHIHSRPNPCCQDGQLGLIIPIYKGPFKGSQGIIAFNSPSWYTTVWTRALHADAQTTHHVERPPHSQIVKWQNMAEQSKQSVSTTAWHEVAYVTAA